MQAMAAEFSGCAEKFYCFLERRVLIAKNPATPKNSTAFWREEF